MEQERRGVLARPAVYLFVSLQEGLQPEQARNAGQEPLIVLIRSCTPTLPPTDMPPTLFMFKHTCPGPACADSWTHTQKFKQHLLPLVAPERESVVHSSASKSDSLRSII